MIECLQEKSMKKKLMDWLSSLIKVKKQINSREKEHIAVKRFTFDISGGTLFVDWKQQQQKKLEQVEMKCL